MIYFFYRLLCIAILALSCPDSPINPLIVEPPSTRPVRSGLLDVLLFLIVEPPSAGPVRSGLLDVLPFLIMEPLSSLGLAFPDDLQFLIGELPSG